MRLPQMEILHPRLCLQVYLRLLLVMLVLSVTPVMIVVNVAMPADSRR